MKLKKTTVLTGNHALKQQRDRAQSDHDVLHNMFKNDLQNHVGTNGQNAQNNGSNNAVQQKYLPKDAAYHGLKPL